MAGGLLGLPLHTGPDIFDGDAAMPHDANGGILDLKMVLPNGNENMGTYGNMWYIWEHDHSHLDSKVAYGNIFSCKASVFLGK